MSDTDPEKSWSRLEVGRRVAVSSPERRGAELPSKITKISSQRFDLELTRSTAGLPFQEGEAIRIKYTEDGVLYCWDGRVEKVSGQEKRSATFSLTGVGVTIHKRKSARVKVSIPFSFMIFDAAQAGIIGDKLLQATTKNISVSGLSFMSDLSLKVGDQLQLSIQLPTQPVDAIGWVVRSESGEGTTEVAVEFLQPEEEQQKRLLEFLAAASEKSGQ